MIKYITEAGFDFTENDDLVNNQFTHIRTDSNIDEEISVCGNYRFVYTMEFRIFLREYDIQTMMNTVDSIEQSLNSQPLYPDEALYPSTNLYPETGDLLDFESISYTDEKVENGYFVNLIIQVRDN